MNHKPPIHSNVAKIAASSIHGFERYLDLTPQRMDVVVFQRCLMDVFWQLVTEGILAPGENAGGLNLPWVHLTVYGRQVLADGEYQPHDRTGYELRHVEAYESLEHRIVVDWGRNQRQWVQNSSNKEVLEFLPIGGLLTPFADYLDFSLGFSELGYLFNQKYANVEWRSRLSAVGGVYLILDSSTGNNYVGSAYGAQGFWGRWRAFAKDGHGGNVRLKVLYGRGRRVRAPLRLLDSSDRSSDDGSV